MQIPARTYGACPNLLMTNPWVGAGTGAPGGAGTSRGARLAGFPDERQPRSAEIASKLAPILRRSPFPARTLVRSCSVLRAGTNAASALFAVRRHRPGRPCGARTRLGRVDAVCLLAPSAERPARVRSRSAVLEPLLARPASRRRACPVRAVGAQRRLAASRSAPTSTQALSVARRGNLIAQRQLAARLRLMYEQGDVEPLEIIFGSKNLDEALSSGLDNLNRMTHQSEDVLRQIEAAHAALKAAQRPPRDAPGGHRRSAGRGARDRRFPDPDARRPPGLRLVARDEAPAERTSRSPFGG